MSKNNKMIEWVVQDNLGHTPAANREEARTVKRDYKAQGLKDVKILRNEYVLVNTTVVR